ncbi:MAG: hypothetical protein QGG42_08625 [Phycisphaerae bacterium]|jgi:hypothetical protein|nr:hypothetical protein [Phycisphaerae bacterium]
MSPAQLSVSAVFSLSVLCVSAQAGIVTQRWGQAPQTPPPSNGSAKPADRPPQPRKAKGCEILPTSENQHVVRFDLSTLPKDVRIYRADLRIFRTRAIDGRQDEAVRDIDIRPLGAAFKAGDKPAEVGDTLKLRGPWYDRFDATGAVRAWAAGKPNGGFLVRACPLWRRDAVALDVAYEGEVGKVPAQASGLKVLHRAGQTFIVFRETDDRSSSKAPTWAAMKQQLDTMDARSELRYRIYRSAERITADTLAKARLLGEVKPMSGYNIRGRSVDQLIAIHRRRALEDTDFAKRLARNNYFSKYHPDMPEMGEVRIGRLAIVPAKPLEPHMGLYVHQPKKPGRAYYAVVSVADGVANTRDFSGANTTGQALGEVVGPGQPVLQGQPDVTVFYDYPGRRNQYVQWSAPPHSHLPNQYYNWGVFLPRDFATAAAKRMVIFFHDYRQRYLKPPWPHRKDAIILSPHDAPIRSFGYGYHESLGTLRSLKQGKVQPFFARRTEAFTEWALRKFGADAGRVSCGGRGYLGGTAALQYGLRRPGKIAYICAENSPDPDPRQTPDVYSRYGRGDRSDTRRKDMVAVWGRIAWGIEAQSGKKIWDEVNLPAYVRSVGDRKTLPFISLGAGAMHVTWKQETELMKAYLDTRNAVMAPFFWGGRAHVPLPAEEFEPRTDRPVLACNALVRSPNAKFFETHFDTGKRGYGGGSRLNTRPRWNSETIVDQPDRLEITIYTAPDVTYAGKVACDVTIRNLQRFAPKRGVKLQWTTTDLKSKKLLQRGRTKVDEHGHIPIANVTFAAPARLIVRLETKEVEK